MAKRGDYLLVEDADRLSRQDRLTAPNFVAGITASPLFQRPVVNGVGFEDERQALVAVLEVRKWLGSKADVLVAAGYSRIQDKMADSHVSGQVIERKF